MKAYIKGDMRIRATEKAYNAIYQEQGFVSEESILEHGDGSTEDNNGHGDSAENLDKNKKSFSGRKSADK